MRKGQKRLRQEPGILILDGRQVKSPPEELVASLTPGVCLYQGVFETMRSYEGRMFGLTPHLCRLERGWRLLGNKKKTPLSFIKKDLGAALNELGKRDARIRVSVWSQDGQIRRALMASPISPLIVPMQRRGLRLFISSIHKNRGAFSGVKTLDYALLLAAFEEAQRAGADEALLLNRKNEVVEGSRTNIFFVKDGCLRTPALRSGCLKGITRSFVLDWARRRKIAISMRPCSLFEITQADEAFCTSSVMEIVPVIAIGEVVIHNGQPGPFTKMIADGYGEARNGVAVSGEGALCPKIICS